MAYNIAKTRIILKNNTKTVLEESSTILMKGEVVLELDELNKTVKIKVGDGTHRYIDLKYATMTPDDILNVIQENSIQNLSIESGTNNGTIKVIMGDNIIDNIEVMGLGSAAYTDASEYATASQGEKADNAMPKSGGTFTGDVILNSNPSVDLGAATKDYVDQMAESLVNTSDVMVFKGTIGNTGDIHELPTENVYNGYTYKIISDMVIGDFVAKIGDLIIASVKENIIKWIIIPSGNDIITSIKTSDTYVNINIDDTYKSGNIILGNAASKIVAGSVTDNTDNLVTAKQVKSYVENIGYVSTDEHVKTELSNNTKLYLSGVTSLEETTNTEKINAGVFINSENKVESSFGFKGDIDGKSKTSTSAEKLSNGIKVTLTGGIIGDSNKVSGSENDDTINVTVNEINTDYLKNGTKTLILYGGSVD